MTILLHGFWGQPQDWNEVIRGLPLTVDVQAPDLYEDGVLGPALDLPTWTKHFLSWIEARSAGQKVDLVGYSMGARLALHALVARPQSFNRALLLSGNPVFQREEIADREAWENSWAEKFQTQPWQELERAWQEQAVFESAKVLPRRRSDALREKLARSLLNWSPRNHAFGWEEVKQLSPNVDWAFGALDQKYLGIAKTLQELPVRGQISIIPNAGHRLNTEATNFISRWITKQES